MGDATTSGFGPATLRQDQGSGCPDGSIRAVRDPLRCGDKLSAQDEPRLGEQTGTRFSRPATRQVCRVPGFRA